MFKNQKLCGAKLERACKVIWFALVCVMHHERKITSGKILKHYRFFRGGGGGGGGGGGLPKPAERASTGKNVSFAHHSLLS